MKPKAPTRRSSKRASAPPVVVPKTPSLLSRSLNLSLPYVKMLAVFLVGASILSYVTLYVGTHYVVERAVEGPGESSVGKGLVINPENGPEPFPIGVDPRLKTITEHPSVDNFFAQNIDNKPLASRSKSTWFGTLLGKLTQSALYQNLASPTGRILIIQSGERKEQVADNFAKILKWDTAKKEEFLSQVIQTEPLLSEGKFAPSTYLTGRTATPEEVAKMVNTNFDKDVLSRYDESVEAKVPLEDALIIASLLEREAYDFTDMRDISGIIWNRLFANMNLQIDATLQYAKGSTHKKKWWPTVVPNDKYIASAFNTYKNKGLPPAPIANPSLDAILAALNPRKTECMYYFHDRDSGFHCTKTYEEHVKLLKQYYGKGK